MWITVAAGPVGLRRPGIAALATAGDANGWAGTIVSSRQLADTYGVTDTDGSKPDCWGYLAADELVADTVALFAYRPR